MGQIATAKVVHNFTQNSSENESGHEKTCLLHKRKERCISDVQ